MDRSAWLRQMRLEIETNYDTLWAPTYGEQWGTYRNESQLQFLQNFLHRLESDSMILDAACGAGRYMSTLLDHGHRVLGIDQSQGMLDRAQVKFPNVPTEKVGLQEMSYHEAFDGLICMDAMENVFPEDWPGVLNNFHRALKPHGHAYFTVEIADPAEVEEAFQQAKQLGLPVVHGEWVNDGVYHYYPTMEQVREWLQQAGFDILEEGEGDGYHHFIVQKR